jgi:LacI family transcriptional regulator
VAGALANSRYELVVYTVDSIDRLNGYLAGLPLTGNLDGLIIISLPVDDEAAGRLVANTLETVLIEYTHPLFSSITIDDFEGGRLAALHLLAQGHRRCAYIYFGEFPEYSIHPEIQRLNGFRTTLAENHVLLSDENVIAVPRQDIRGKVQELFRRGEPPTGLFVPSDDLAIRVMHCAREIGLQTPQDVSLVAFDNIEIAEHIDLTTVSQRLIDSGRTAVEMLLARLDDPQRPVQQIQLQVYLEERGTTRALTGRLP